MDRCKHELLPDECGDCSGRTGGIPAFDEKPRIVATWQARFPGRCGWCDGSIVPGFGMGRDEHDTYVCHRCLQ